MNDMNDYKTRRMAKLAAMSPDEWEARHARAINDLELIWLLAADKLEEMAGQDDCGQTMQDAAEAHEIHLAFTQLHRRADRFAARVNDRPIAPRNER